MYGKLFDWGRKLVEARLDDMLKVQRPAVDRIIQRTARRAAYFAPCPAFGSPGPAVTASVPISASNTSPIA